MSVEIHKSKERAALLPRREPYWGPPIGSGQYLGYRKIDNTRGSWVARMRDPDTAQQSYKAVGADPGMDYTTAKSKAETWFKDRDAGIRGEEITVEAACKLYVADRRREKGEACAHDAAKRFERTIYNSSLGKMLVRKIKTPAIKSWLDALEAGKPGKKRTLSTFKAAMNLAVRSRLVSADCKREWSEVRPPKDADRRRELFLDLSQRRALLAHAPNPFVRDLMEAAMLTGARPGELVSALRSQFDSRTVTMKFIGKTGARTVPLSVAAAALFTRLAKLKLPNAHLLVRPDGKRWGHSDWDGYVRQAAKDAELPEGVCLYTLRHSFITQAISDGLTTLDVARMVGTSIVMIDKNYGHLVGSALRERLARVEMF